MSTNPIARVTRGPRETRRTGPPRAKAERGILARLAQPVHQQFREAAVRADVRQSDLFRAFTLEFLEDEAFASRMIDRARALRDA